MSPDCSIIIPAYNAQSTIIESLNSIELEKEWEYLVEVVVIDDGSIDDTIKVTEEFAKEYNEITIVSQKNKGVSSARNVGIIRSSGKYIFFMDADDKLNRMTLEKMISIAEQKKVDLVISDYFQYNTLNGEKKRICSKIQYDIVLSDNDKKSIFERYFLGDKVGLSNLWNKLFRSSVIKTRSLQFDEKRTHGEDWAFCIEFFQHCCSFIAVNDVVYEYRLDGTQTRTKYIKTLAYCLVDGHQIAKEINNRYLHFSSNSNEYLLFMKSFYYQIISFIKMDCSNSEKTQLLREDEVQDCISYLRKVDNRLVQNDFSRRDRLCLLLLSLGLYKVAIKYFVK